MTDERNRNAEEIFDPLAGREDAETPASRLGLASEFGNGEAGNLGGFGEPGIQGMDLATEPDRSVEQDIQHGGDLPVEAYASEEEAITDINDLDLQSEPMEDVDMDKLEEALAYAPTLKPGAFHSFIFKLDDEKPWQAVTMKGKPEAQFNYQAVNLKEDGTEGKTLRYQNASTFRSGKMTASRADELLFALGKLKKFKSTERKKGNILELLAEASAEGVVFEGQVQWRHYDKSSGITTSTNPAKPYKKTDKATGQEITVTEQAWPRDEKGQFARHPGNETIARVRPTKEVQEAQKKEAA